VRRIVDVVVKLAATHGLEAVSMGRVAGDLGVTTMSLYRYVDAKDGLPALMADAAFGPPPVPCRAGEEWRPHCPDGGEPSLRCCDATRGCCASPSGVYL
jgi:hypothetical protein